MKNLVLACSALIICTTYALELCPQTLPPSHWIDTEAITNIPFAGHPLGKELRDFRIQMSLLATPSNNVQVAFGEDFDGNGELSFFSDSDSTALVQFYNSNWNLIHISVHGIDSVSEHLIVSTNPWGLILKLR